MLFPLMHSINQRIVWPELIIFIKLAHEHIRNVPLVFNISKESAADRIPHFIPQFINKLPTENSKLRFSLKMKRSLYD